MTIEQAQADVNGLYRQIRTDASRTSQQVLRDLQTKPVQLRPGIRGNSDANGKFATELRILTGVGGFTAGDWRSRPGKKRPNVDAW